MVSLAPEATLLELVTDGVRACYACADMDHCHVLGPANGPDSARVMFIGEAPGHLGAARTGVPFSGDQSGLRFERLLAAAGLPREEVFVTNAVLCNPLREGRNRPPKGSEIAACTPWLRAQIDAVDPALVVTLGGVALAAARLIEPHAFVLRADAGQALRWYGRTLVPLCHPSPRTAVRRSFARQSEDFRRLGEALRRAGG